MSTYQKLVGEFELDLETAVSKAQKGDKKALEVVITTIQDKIYYLALRMLCNPEDAKDAAQEILILIVTKLSTFQFRSKFTTWVYRVSANYLLDTKKNFEKDLEITFDDFKQDLESDLVDPTDLKNSPEYPLLLNELRIMCTVAMLMCLDKKHRLAYIIGDIFELNHSEASEILSLSKENYRKQLSRARLKVINFTKNSCGLVDDCASCHCDKKLAGAIKRTRINKNYICFADKSEETYTQVKESIAELAEDLRTVYLQNAIPFLKFPVNFIKTLESIDT